MAINPYAKALASMAKESVMDSVRGFGQGIKSAAISEIPALSGAVAFARSLRKEAESYQKDAEKSNDGIKDEVKKQVRAQKVTNNLTAQMTGLLQSIDQNTKIQTRFISQQEKAERQNRLFGKLQAREKKLTESKNLKALQSGGGGVSGALGGAAILRSIAPLLLLLKAPAFIAGLGLLSTVGAAAAAASQIDSTKSDDKFLNPELIKSIDRRVQSRQNRRKTAGGGQTASGKITEATSAVTSTDDVYRFENLNPSIREAAIRDAEREGIQNLEKVLTNKDEFNSQPFRNRKNLFLAYSNAEAGATSSTRLQTQSRTGGNRERFSTQLSSAIASGIPERIGSGSTRSRDFIIPTIDANAAKLLEQANETLTNLNTTSNVVEKIQTDREIRERLRRTQRAKTPEELRQDALERANQRFLTRFQDLTTKKIQEPIEKAIKPFLGAVTLQQGGATGYRGRTASDLLGTRKFFDQTFGKEYGPIVSELGQEYLEYGLSSVGEQLFKGVVGEKDAVALTGQILGNIKSGKKKVALEQFIYGTTGTATGVETVLAKHGFKTPKEAVQQTAAILGAATTDIVRQTTPMLGKKPEATFYNDPIRGKVPFTDIANAPFGRQKDLNVIAPSLAERHKDQADLRKNNDEVNVRLDEVVDSSKANASVTAAAGTHTAQATVVAAQHTGNIFTRGFNSLINVFRSQKSAGTTPGKPGTSSGAAGAAGRFGSMGEGFGQLGDFALDMGSTLAIQSMTSKIKNPYVQAGTNFLLNKSLETGLEVFKAGGTLGDFGTAMVGQQGMEFLGPAASTAGYMYAAKQLLEGDVKGAAKSAAITYGIGLLLSDKRLKKDIVPLQDMSNGLTLYSYKWKDEKTLGAGTNVGYMAQEVEKLYPSVVSEIDGIKAIDYDKLNKISKNTAAASSSAASGSTSRSSASSSSVTGARVVPAGISRYGPDYKMQQAVIQTEKNTRDTVKNTQSSSNTLESISDSSGRGDTTTSVSSGTTQRSGSKTPISDVGSNIKDGLAKTGISIAANLVVGMLGLTGPIGLLAVGYLSNKMGDFFGLNDKQATENEKFEKDWAEATKALEDANFEKDWAEATKELPSNKSSGGGFEGRGDGEFGGRDGMAGDPSGTGPAGGTAFAAKGGILSGPKSGFPATLHGTEAVVPLPDSRNIPVELRLKDMIPQSSASNLEIIRTIQPVMPASQINSGGVAGQLGGGNINTIVNNTNQTSNVKHTGYASRNDADPFRYAAAIDAA